jgi:transposase
MFDVNDGAKKAGFRRVEVLTGPGRRRRWSAAEKARIIAETLVPGARVSAVARRWQICPQQVFGWRRQARMDVAEQPPDPSRCLSSAFVPIVTEAVTAARPAGSASPPAVIEIKLAGAVVRVVSGTDTALLRAVLRAVRSSVAPA